MLPLREPAAPGQESVWDYPRPPRLEASAKRLQLVLGGVVIADTRDAFRLLETSHPPTYYIPQADVAMEHLRLAVGSSHCEWKGRAVYFHVQVGDRFLEEVAWSYPDPTPDFRHIAGMISFYPGPFDAALVDGVQVQAQPGGFYGGWVTPDLAGPFKGAPGSELW